jgi:hypothetical protein
MNDFLLNLFLKIISAIWRKEFSPNYVSKKKETVGLLSADQMEGIHNFERIQSYIYEEDNNTLYIGSPYLSYWLNSGRITRLERLLNNTKKFKVTVIYYSDTPSNDYVCKLEKIKNEYKVRFNYSLEKYSTISYIVYNYKSWTTSIYTRAIVGYQGGKYEKRPFVEFVSKKEHCNDFVQRIIDSHNSYFKGE